MKRSTIVIGLLAGVTCFAGVASAQSASWTGPYVGGAIGYSKQAGNSDERLEFDTNRDGSYGDTVRTTTAADAFSPGFCDGAAKGRTPAEGCQDSDGNLNVSLRAGYDWQFGSWVVGGLADIAAINIGEDVAAFSTTPASYTFTRDLKSTIALRARGGYAFDRYLAYGTAGVVRGDIDHNFYTSNTANSFSRSDTDDNYGYQVGAGVEMQWTEHMTVGVEYLYSSLKDDDYTVAIGPGTAPATNPFLLANATGTDTRRTEEDFDFHTVSLTASYRF